MYCLHADVNICYYDLVNRGLINVSTLFSNFTHNSIRWFRFFGFTLKNDYFFHLVISLLQRLIYIDFYYKVEFFYLCHIVFYFFLLVFICTSNISLKMLACVHTTSIAVAKWNRVSIKLLHNLKCCNIFYFTFI